jgi:hypothetical protein
VWILNLLLISVSWKEVWVLILLLISFSWKRWISKQISVTLREGLFPCWRYFQTKKSYGRSTVKRPNLISPSSILCRSTDVLTCVANSGRSDSYCEINHTETIIRGFIKVTLLLYLHLHIFIVIRLCSCSLVYFTIYLYCLPLTWIWLKFPFTKLNYVSMLLFTLLIIAKVKATFIQAEQALRAPEGWNFQHFQVIGIWRW